MKSYDPMPLDIRDPRVDIRGGKIKSYKYFAIECSFVLVETLILERLLCYRVRDDLYLKSRLLTGITSVKYTIQCQIIKQLT